MGIRDVPPPSRSNPALQKEDTAWNNDIHSPCSKPYRGQNHNDISTAPVPSQAAVTSRARRVSRTTPPICSAPTESISTERRCSPMRRCSSSATRMDTVIKLNPPIWMSTTSTACPNKVNWVMVSYSVSPVTQDAEADVNSASKKGRHCPSRDEMGSISSSAPARIRQAKLTTRFCTAFNRKRRRFMVSPSNGKKISAYLADPQDPTQRWQNLSSPAGIRPRPSDPGTSRPL